MSDLKDRVGVLTGGNANLIPNAGDLITGDGNQTVYLRGDGVADGMVLTKDSTAEEGMSWQPGGGGAGGISNVTGSNGVTVTTPGLGLRNATNDLVTGTTVAQINADASGAVAIQGGSGGPANVALTNTSSGAVLNLASSGLIRLQNPAGGRYEVSAAGDANLHGNLSTGNADIEAGANVVVVGGQGAAGGNLSIANSNDAGAGVTIASSKGTGAGSGDVAITADAATGGVDIAAGLNATFESVAGGIVTVRSTGGNGSVQVSTAGTGDINLVPNHDLAATVGRDEVHTVGRNFTLAAAGTGGILISATNAASANADVKLSVNSAGTGAIQLSGQSVGGPLLTLNGALTSIEADGTSGDFIINTPKALFTITGSTGSITLDADSALGGGKLVLQPSATGVIQEYGGSLGAAQSAAIPAAAGGVVIDAEARAALNALLTYFRLRGTVAP